MQLLEGYAFLLAGVIELYEATLEPKHLDFAIALAEAMIAKFYDAENGGFWQSAAGAKDLILRVKEDYDGAEPSGNSVAILALLKLGRITGRKEFTQAAREDPAAVRRPARSNFPRPCRSCCRRWISRSKNPGASSLPAIRPAPKTQALLRAIHSVYQPNKVVLGNIGRGRALCPNPAGQDGPVVYLCTGTACQPPTRDRAKIRNY